MGSVGTQKRRGAEVRYCVAPERRSAVESTSERVGAAEMAARHGC